MQNLSINPELKSLIPPLTAEEFKQLETNVCQEGIREPIITWQGTIVDGHNRYELAQMHDLPFKVKEMAFTSMEDCMDWMINNQLGRRNVTETQKAYLIGKKYENEKQREGRPNTKLEQNVPVSTAERLGEEFGISHIQVKRNEDFAKGVDLLANVEPELKGQILQGKSDLNKQDVQEFGKISKQAQKEVKQTAIFVSDEELKRQINERASEMAKVKLAEMEEEKRFKKEEKAKVLSERKQREIAEGSEVKKQVADFNVQFGQVWRLGRHTLICGSAYDFAKIDATAIITDPPYGIDYSPEWKKWNGSESDYKKIEGDAKEFDPRPFLNYPTVLMFGANYFTKHLPQGGWLCWDKRLRDELDEMVGSPFELAWFKSSLTKRSAIMIRVLHGGVVNADSVQGNNQKRFHPTQKPVVLMEEIIKKVTKEKEVICDPFCGSGTTLIAAENTGRTCIAYEIEPLYCNVILSRYEQLTNQKPCLESKE
jgi:hypothetical protein